MEKLCTCLSFQGIYWPTDEGGKLPQDSSLLLPDFAQLDSSKPSESSLSSISSDDSEKKKNKRTGKGSQVIRKMLSNSVLWKKINFQQYFNRK